MARRRTDYSGIPQGTGEPVDATGGAGKEAGTNFDAARMRNFLDDWEKTKAEIRTMTETYITPLKQHLQDGRKLAKEAGFNLKIMDEILADRALTPGELEDLDSLRDLYRFHAKLRAGDTK